MKEEQLITATQEVLRLGWNDDQGLRIGYSEGMDCKGTLEKLIPHLQKSDFFTKETAAVLAEMGWTRETAGEKPSTENVKQIPVDEFQPEPEINLVQDIQNLSKLKDLKEIALSEPQFKKIRGKIASFNAETLKIEMLFILTGEKPKKNAVNDIMEKASKTFDPIPEEPNVDLKQISEDVNKSLEPIKYIEVEDADGLFDGTIGLSDIVKKEPFSSLFVIHPDTLTAITANMKEKGFDFAFPVILWGNILVDGFTRTKAAENAGLEFVPFERKEFADEHEALEYAMHNQRDRRNITEAELLRCISVLDVPMTREEASAKRGKSEPTHKKTAKTLGIGESKVTDARTVLTDEQAIEDVKAGKKSLHTAANEIREKNKAKKPKKEKILASLTRVESIVSILRDNAGNDLEIADLDEKAGSLYVSCGGEMFDEDSLTETVVEVLVAVGLVKRDGDVISVKKGLK